MSSDTEISYDNVLSAVREALPVLKPQAAWGSGPIGEDFTLFSAEYDGVVCLELDSIDVAELTIIIDDANGISVPDELDFGSCRTLADLVRLIVANAHDE